MARASVGGLVYFIVSQALDTLFLWPVGVGHTRRVAYWGEGGRSFVALCMAAGAWGGVVLDALCVGASCCLCACGLG